MNILIRLRTQDAVYWPPASEDQETGQHAYGSPVDCKCRWIEIQELFLMRDGAQGLSKAYVDLDLAPEEDAVLRKGKIADLPAAILPAANAGAWKPFAADGAWLVRGTKRIPKVRAKTDTDPNKTLMRAVL